MLYNLLFDSNYIIKKYLIKSIYSYRSYINGRVLDFGCGTKPYKEFFSYTEYIGLDIEVSGHPYENKKADIFYDGKIIPFENNYFDSIFSSEVFEHISNIEEVIKELNRVLKKDGHILITTPFVWGLHEIPYDFTRFTIFGLESLLNKNGFEIVEKKFSTNNIQTITQMWATYLSKILFIKNGGKINGIINLLFIAPVVIFGQILSFLLPKTFDFYHNNIVVAKKTSLIKPHKNGLRCYL